MAKYTFQTGGEAFDYTNNDFFNSVVDQAQQQDYSQQYEQDNSQPTAEDQQPEEENDYIKNLRAYDDSQPNEDYTNKLSELEQRLNSRFDELSQQYQQQSYLGSPDGVDQLNDLYDSRTPTSPVVDDLNEAQLQAESGGDDNAVSPKGAMGAFQFMPSTWEQYKPSADASPFNRTDAQYARNKYMNVLMQQFGNDHRKALAAYNAGPGRVSKLIQQYGEEWEQHLPQETKGYLNKIENIQTKSGASIQNINKGLLGLVSGLNNAYPGLVVTSGTDGQHTRNSAHYDGDAVDIGANSSSKEAYSSFKEVLPTLRRKYGIKYLDEGDHIHLSLSSKGKT